MLTIDKEKGIAIHEYVDQMGIKHIDKTNLKAPITRGFDINWKPYDENNLIGWKNSLLKLMSDSNNRIDMGNNAYKKAMNWNNSEILKLWDDIFMGGIK